MISLSKRTGLAVAGVVATMALVVPARAGAQATVMSISGGTGVDSIPKGISANSVLGQAGIGFAGGQIWVDGALNIEGDNVAITLYDVGSESGWKDQIRLSNTSSKPIKDVDNHGRGSTGKFTNGSAPFQLKGAVTQDSGVAKFEFWRLDVDPDIKLVVNGQSPTMSVPNYSASSIALAYLDDANQIVAGPTNRVLVLLEDGDNDGDYDDYVGILAASPPPHVGLVSISGGTAADGIPQGTSGHSVLGQAGIGFDGGQIWVDGTLDILSNKASIALSDVGSESHWANQIRLANTASSLLKDNDNHWRGSTGNFVNGSAPFQLIGSVIQKSGMAQFEFWRMDSDPDYQIVVNGLSPMMMVPNYGYASIALAYLSDSNQIVSEPTNRILVLLEDGGLDRDYDDYVGILTVLPIVP